MKILKRKITKLIKGKKKEITSIQTWANINRIDKGLCEKMCLTICKIFLPSGISLCVSFSSCEKGRILQWCEGSDGKNEIAMNGTENGFSLSCVNFFFPFDVGKCFRYMLCIPAIIQCFDEFMTFSFLRKKENSKPALDQQMVATEPLMKWCNFVGGKFHYFFCSLEFHFWWSLIP